jgi:hypothetical protein
VTLVRNKATDEGRELGTKLAEWCDAAEPVARLAEPALPPRCKSCAFRRGDHLANGSPGTLMNALKCVMEHETFECHQHDRKGQPCSGWAMLVLADTRGPISAPWDFVAGGDKSDLLKSEQSR